VEALANWLWQGCAVTVAAAVALHVMPRTTATARYRLWWVTLALVLAIPFASSFPWFPPVAAGRVPPAVPPAPMLGGEGQSIAIAIPTLPWWALTVLLGLWAAWVGVSLARLARGLHALVRAKRSCAAFPADLEARLPIWRAIRSSGRSARLVVSNDVKAAALLGLRHPAIAVAPAVLDELTPGEIDQVLVHEWAHVQRRDDIWRLVQVAVTAIAGLHPAVWWIDRRLHLERETACDDWTVNMTGSRKRYAECLTKLASLAGMREIVLVPAVLSSSTFTARIVRLLDRRRDTSTDRRLPSLTVMSSLLAATALIAAGFELVVSHPIASEDVASARSADSMALPLIAAPVSADAATPPRGATASTPAPRRGRTHSKAPLLSPAPRVLPASIVQTVPVVVPVPATTHPDAPSSAPLAALPETLTPVAVGSPPSAEPTSLAPLRNPAPWRIAADAGVSVGRGSQKAAAATAGFFSRLGKSIARRGHSIVTVTGDSHD
jgi:beta-lactamase regulating signal transducer with metallopeptidase domain